MVDKVARLHFQHASPAGALRTLSGWLIAITGLALLVAQLVRSVEGFDLAVTGAMAGGAMAAAATALGAVPLLVVRQIGASVQGMLLGFGAGVMLAASVFSLLLPGFDAALAQTGSETGAALLVAFGVLLGAGGLLAMDRALPHTHFPEGRRSGAAVWLFVFAIAVHNIPEGLAIGVAAGLEGTGAGSGDAVAAGISLQNVPEGLIVAIALVAAGYGRWLAFGVAAASGLIEPIAAIAGSMMVSVSANILPWGLAGAAGAMLFVVSHEIIPESHRRGHETLATGGLMVGFVMMMLMDTLLG
ncbi:MAG TPA: ZIP family metal transporter [Thauera aminoaromatica]|jgi:ZIP family zinc transporter|uniref:ZIP family metal transporter n=1 Tax=Thauera sp. SWB20 TaxID=1572758 RepID=UPI0005ADC065|nr:ZIP family metal transporter [Thauera sp. SWB20]OPZ05820.1 MAG: Zinc transporter ZupT [Alphaproteobacteria bacterium ADurb.BinA305]HMY77915.1 ZIP family metal transporter [Thauera aminoaromatica]KIN92432.1 ZIP Zinc transporter family protein [Thauera sp. SWB20]HND58221.1 ZIP family metal transporter [Thauera aminoaromatica]HNE99556.1 ZIP family metal transporter [Thauera aminoaromatica]